MTKTSIEEGHIAKIKAIQELLKQAMAAAEQEVAAGEHYMTSVFRSLQQPAQIVKARIDQIQSWIDEAKVTNKAEEAKLAADRAVKMGGVRGELMAKTMDQLKAIVATDNAEPDRADKDKIVLAGNANKEAYVAAILKAHGYSESAQGGAKQQELQKPDEGEQAEGGASKTLGAL